MATFTWRDGVSGSWFDSANWTTDQVPGTSDTAIIGSGTPQVSSGGAIIGERVQLGAGASGGTVTLDATDATFAPLTSGTSSSPTVVENMFLTVTGGGSSAPVSATFMAHGTTTFEGELIVEPINGALTISAGAVGGESGDFEFLNATDKSFGLVTQESVLNLAGQEITNNAPIEIEGTLNLASGTTLAGSGLVAMDNGGHLNLSGTVSSGLAIDFVDGTGAVAIASGATVSADFGFAGIAGGRIDLAGVTATSAVVTSSVSGSVLTLLSGGTAVADFKVFSVNAELEPTPPPPSTADFTVTSDGQGGTLVTYTPQGPTTLQASLPVPVVAPTGSLVSLASILGQSFGPATPGFYQIKLIAPTIQTNTPTDQKFWSSEVAPAWYVNGVPITGDYVVQPGDNVQFLVGNNIANPAQIQVQVTPTVTSDSGEYVDYSIWTVDPSVAAQVASSGGIAGHPTSSSVIAAAYALSGAFPDVPNTNLCNSIADDVAAAAGAPMPLPNTSFDPPLNAQGGFWRIVYEGTSLPDPPQDWSSLVSGGDIIRMQWFHPTSPADESGHTTTALGQVFTSGGQELIKFYDNDDAPSNLPGSIIGIHDDNYWNRTDPASITIYQLDPNQQYLISGTSQSEIIQGSVYNNLIVPGGGADTITAGAGSNEIQDTTANLASITVTDFHQGDELDFTDLKSNGVTVERSGIELLVSSSGTQVADITLPAQLPPGEVFTVASDGASGSLIALSAATPITWANGSDGRWSDATNWSGGVVPGASDYAIINVSGSYAVSVTSSTAVNALSIFNAAAELRVDGATFTAGTLSTLDDIDVLNGGTVDVLVDASVTSAVFGSGTIKLGGLSGTTVTLSSSVASGAVIDFAGAAGTLQLTDPTHVLGTIDGFAPGDRIDLANIAFDSTTSVSLHSGNVLEITFGSSGATLQLDPAQSFAGESFHVVSDGVSGTDVILTADVSSGMVRSLTSGQTVIGASVLSDGTLDVLPGGTASDTTVNNGGFVEVFSAGRLSGTDVHSGGTLEVFGGAAVSATTFEAGATLVIGSNEVRSGFTVSGGLTVDVLFSGLTQAGAVASDGILTVLNGGKTSAMTLSAGGRQILEMNGVASATTIAGGTLELAVGGFADGAITFAGSGGTLQIDGTSMPGNVISGFMPGDQFYLAGVAFDSGGSADLLSGNVLQITAAGQTYDLNLDPGQDFTGDFFHLSPLSGGTVVTEDNTPCYCPGTLIATARGEVAVEELAIGDEVLTLSGAARPIKWIGRRSYAGRFARSAHVLPICIKAGALDVGQPRRDLWVSPHHAMFLEGVLIEAIDLVNGISIIQAERVDRVDYVHIEFDTHDVIIAEGAFSESFVDDDSRGIFQNAHEFAALYPDTPRAPARYCAPRRAFGTEIEAARRQIARRAGLPYAAPRLAEQPRALVVDSRIPELGHDGGSNAILDHVRALQAAGFAVSFLALPSRSFHDFARAHAGAFDLVYLHRVETATRCLKLARQYFDAQIVYSVADLHHLRLKAQSRFDPEHAFELIQEAQTTALQELAAALMADSVITHSISEAAQLEQLDTIAHARKVRVVPWTVPLAPVRTPFTRRTGVAFIGNFAHAPNRDAARWLVDEIMPLVWREAPELHCLIAGSDLPVDFSRELARPRVSVLGHVPRLSDVFERSRLTVAPLRFGAGLKDKVLRSMAASVPCIGTAEAFSGMPQPPADIISMCQRESASDLARAIVAMHQHEEANARCARRGLSYVAEFYNQARIDALMRDLVEPALDRYRARARSVSGCTVLQFGYDDNPARRIAAT